MAAVVVDANVELLSEQSRRPTIGAIGVEAAGLKVEALGEDHAEHEIACRIRLCLRRRSGALFMQTHAAGQDGAQLRD